MPIQRNKSPRTGRPAGRRLPRSREGLLKAIAVLKFVKALLLAAVSLGSFNLLNPTMADKAERWVSAMAWRIGPKAAFAVQDKVSALPASELRLAGTVALLYGCLFAVEGVGLWRSKRWAEYLTIVATTSFVPFELYALVRHASWHRVATLAVNLLVVGYLVWKVRQRPS
jgi:uncharacterized membrane protein (DUF2068 family)